MVELKNARYTKYGSVQVSNNDLEYFAYAQLKEFDKTHFKKPHALNIDEFVEFYLKKKFFIINFRLMIQLAKCLERQQ